MHLLKFGGIAGYQLLQNIYLSSDHFQFKVFNSTIVHPPHARPVDDRVVGDDFILANNAERPYLTVLWTSSSSV
jgi:hypothetical protein